MSRYVLDSYAILALHRQEAHAFRVEALLSNRRHEHWMSAINVGEVYYRVARELNRPTAEQALEAIHRYRVEIVDADLHVALEAAKLKAQYALSYADCFAAVLARSLGAAVVTGDPEFIRLEEQGLLTLEWLGTRRR